jgi:Ubiquitin carboxyl-terminal hydrolase
LKHQTFTDISLPFESLGVTCKKVPASKTATTAKYQSETISSESGPLIGGLPLNTTKRTSEHYNNHVGKGLNLKDCLRDFMKEEELQQDVECQSCSWAETLKAFERKSSSVSIGEGIKFTGQYEEEKLNKILLKQFKTAMPEGNLDSCSVDLDDVLFSTDIDVDDASSITDSISLPMSVRSTNTYSSWRMRSGLGLANTIPNKTTKLDSYLVQKVRTKTRKQLILSRPPPILCLHICRRVADALTGRLKKLNHHVSFPGVLDIGDYVNSQKGAQTDDQDSSKVKPIESQTVRPNLGPRTLFGIGSGTGSGSTHSPNEYLLRSVIVHTGSSEAGECLIGYDFSSLKFDCLFPCVEASVMI